MYSIAAQMDDFAQLNPAMDGTILLLRAAYRRGYKLFIYHPTALSLQSDGQQVLVYAHGAWVTDWPEQQALPTMAAPQRQNLAEMHIVLMRQEPPFDMDYITATYILEHLPPQVMVVNNPKAVRDAPEKLFITRYPHLMPPTLVSHDLDEITVFQAEHGTLVLKPLYGFGAGDIMLLPPDAPPEQLADYQRVQHGLPFIAQKFLPAVAAGDKRIIVLAEEIVGALNRVPPAGQFLANLHVGGRPEAATVTAVEAAIVQQFAGDLSAMGIILAGIDMIGGYVTEINVTCPSALAETNLASGLTGAARLEERFWSIIEKQLDARFSAPSNKLRQHGG